MIILHIKQLNFLENFTANLNQKRVKTTFLYYPTEEELLFTKSKVNIKIFLACLSSITLKLKKKELTPYWKVKEVK